MDRIIKLTRNQANELLEKLKWHKENGSSGLHSLRIAVNDSDDTVRVKINQSSWSPPTGALDPECRKAARQRVSERSGE